MERKIPSEETQEAYYTLFDVYKRATKGEIANPGSAITYVRPYPDGRKVRLFSNNWRLYARITENDGTERGFGIHRDGLRDVSLVSVVDSEMERTSINVEGLDEADRERFRGLSTVLVPWVVGRYLGGQEQSLPDGVQEYFSELSTS